LDLSIRCQRDFADELELDLQTATEFCLQTQANLFETTLGPARGRNEQYTHGIGGNLSSLPAADLPKRRNTRAHHSRVQHSAIGGLNRVLGSSDNRTHQGEATAAGARPRNSVAQVSNAVPDERLGKAIQLRDHKFSEHAVRQWTPIRIDHLDDLHIVIEMQRSWALNALPRYRPDLNRGVYIEGTHPKSFLAELATAVTQGHGATVDQAGLNIAHAGFEYRLRKVF